MSIDISSIEFPGVVFSGVSSELNKEEMPYEESFSKAFQNKLPVHFLKEMVVAYGTLNGYSSSAISEGNRALRDFCEFSLNNNVTSLDDVDSQLVTAFLDFLKHKYRENNAWVWRFTYFKTAVSALRPAILWPLFRQSGQSQSSDSTPAHTAYAFQQIIQALQQKEIPRIRQKIGRYEEALTKGNILTIEEIEKHIKKGAIKTLTNKQIKEYYNEIKKISQIPNNKIAKKEYQAFRNKHGLSWSTFDKLRGGVIKNKIPRGISGCELSISKDDIIATIAHYLPDWPMEGRTSKRHPRRFFRVYQKPRGVFLKQFYNILEAETYAKEHQGYVVTGLKRSSFTQLNPAEYILASFSMRYTTTFSKYLAENGYSQSVIFEEYFPTTYDFTCILLYWLCITGWNLETARSVTLQRLLREDDPIRILPNLVSIEGDAPVPKPRKSVSLEGRKRRGQPEQKPKPFRHISDLDDEFGLYRVLMDYYKLSLPWRKYLRGDEKNCILIGIKVFDESLGVFGPSKNCMGVFSRRQKNGVATFFAKNPIYEYDAVKVKGSAPDLAETDKERPNSINNVERNDKPGRIHTTNSIKLRATNNAMLEYLDVPPWIRRMFLGHESIDTTVTCYGAEAVARGIRFERLFEILVELEEKAFAGELVVYEQAKKQRGSKVIQIWEHKESPVFICKNRFEPTWHNHEKYVPRGSACDEFGQCLFCKQCIVTEESLAFLLKWLEIISEWNRQVGIADFSIRLEQRRQAIEEILDICRSDDGTWAKALMKAEVIVMDNNFSAPPFWLGA